MNIGRLFCEKEECMALCFGWKKKEEYLGDEQQCEELPPNKLEVDELGKEGS